MSTSTSNPLLLIETFYITFILSIIRSSKPKEKIINFDREIINTIDTTPDTYESYIHDTIFDSDWREENFNLEEPRTFQS